MTTRSPAELSPDAAAFAHRAPDGTMSDDPFVVGPVVLADGAAEGPLAGQRFAVKDLYDVAGTRTGAGNPTRLLETPVAEVHAQSVQALLNAGAQLVGKTVSDELAFSLSGTNVHYGTPVNPVAPDRIPGGSSSGSASAVASGLVDFALGTDTGGSTRVPASYCGIYGLRATQGRISSEGVFLLAPSFCTIGIFTRDGATLGRTWRALRAGASVGPPEANDRVPRELVVVPELSALADPTAAAAFALASRRLAADWELELRVASFSDVGDPSEIFSTFRTIQMYEAWQLHGAWVAGHHDALGWGITARFDAASGVDAEAFVAAVERRGAFQQRFNEFLGDGAYLLQPATSGVAPLVSLRGPEKDDLRLRTMTLTAPAGLAGAPVVALPVAASDGLPIGVACVGRPGDDDALTKLAAGRSEMASGRLSHPLGNGSSLD